MKISKTLKGQIKQFINQGESLVNIINYLFTCDYTATEILEILVSNFNCQEQLLKDVFKIDFEIDLA